MSLASKQCPGTALSAQSGSSYIKLGTGHSFCDYLAFPLLLQISLVEQPHLSYSIMVQGGDISFLPGLEVFINTLLKDVVLRPYIAPQGFTLPLVPGGGREVTRLPSLATLVSRTLFSCSGILPYHKTIMGLASLHTESAKPAYADAEIESDLHRHLLIREPSRNICINTC